MARPARWARSRLAAPDRTRIGGGLAALLTALVAASALWDPDEPRSASRPPPRGSTSGILLVSSSVSLDGGSVARLEIVWLDEATAELEVIEQSRSDVFHAARCDPDVPGAIVTAAGTEAAVERWRRDPSGRWISEDLWRAAFGVRSSRMRDLEIGRVLGARETASTFVVGTHDEGVVAVLVPDGQGTRVVELDRRDHTLVHEIELGDLDGDGVTEIYATTSPPNTLIPGIEQPGEVVRYVPALGQGRVQVIDLAPRHAKEILVTDLDDDGRDELYVVVEARTVGRGDATEILEPVEIRRITSSEPAPGRLLTTLPDRLTRFLAAGDVDGDGQRELVAAAFSSGLWLLRPGASDAEPWTREQLDADSGGYEHAMTLADLDEDGRDELYVADDPRGELRRYTWAEGRLTREVLARHAASSRITWNLTTCHARSAGEMRSELRVE